MDDSMRNVLDFCRSSPPQRGMLQAMDYCMKPVGLMTTLREESGCHWKLEQRFNEVALATNLEHSMDMLTLTHTQNLPAFQDGVAGVMIALEKYQQAYDFLKLSLSDPEHRGNQEREAVPFLSLVKKGENLFEPLENLHISRSCNLCKVLEMALLKLCIFSNVRGAQLFAQNFGFNHDIVSVVGSFLNVPKDWQTVDAGSLLFQAQQLLSLAHSKNEWVVSALLQRKLVFREKPTLEAHDAIDQAESIQRETGRWWTQHKVAKHFVVNFDKNIDTSLLPVDDLLE
mmetsp:Transcript_13661/g.33026  ORF Transcript_13661/g.33026 Transcript_13661/m.33026 type:complete len:285 (-) Transcript_13661:336-1190(-)